MDQTLSLLIRHTADELAQAEAPGEGTARDYRNLRAEAEHFTDLLIHALFPRFAPQNESREKLLEQAGKALPGASSESVRKLDSLCRKLNRIWFDLESLNMNPQLLFEYLLYDEGDRI